MKLIKPNFGKEDGVKSKNYNSKSIAMSKVLNWQEKDEIVNLKKSLIKISDHSEKGKFVHEYKKSMAKIQGENNQQNS